MSFSSWGQIVIVGLGVLAFVAFVGLYLALTADPAPPDREVRR